MPIKLSEDTPFGAWGGQPGVGFPGFSDYLKNKGYDNEKNILDLLPKLSPEDQVKFDISLNMNSINTFPHSDHLLVSNSKSKAELIPFFQNKINNPEKIRSLINLVKFSKKTHENRAANQLTGSHDWNDMWIGIYNQWLKILYKKLGEVNES